MNKSETLFKGFTHLILVKLWVFSTKKGLIVKKKAVN